MGKDAAYWIERLKLTEHREGGFYRQTYRSAHVVPTHCLPKGFNAPRQLGTAICYLLKGSEKCVLHRIKADELWHFYTGSSLTIYVIEPGGHLRAHKLGGDPEKGESFQVAVQGGCWFGALVEDCESYALVGCTVVPGFDYEDLELGNREELIRLHPRHRELIEKLTG